MKSKPKQSSRKTVASNWKKIFLTSWHPYVLIIIIGFIVYARTLSYDFTYFDDDTLILQNENLLQDLSYLPIAFQEDVFRAPKSSAGYYRPLLTLSFMVDAFLGEMRPFVYRCTNLLLHLLSACLLFLFLEKLYKQRSLNLFFALLFTVHPALTQAIAWIPGRNDSLLAVFALSAFIAFLNFLRTKSLKWYLLHILLFTAAIFSKESGIFLPLIWLLFLHLIHKEKFLSHNESILVFGWLLSSSLWYYLRGLALHNYSHYSLQEMFNFILENSYSIILFIGKAILPFNLSTYPILKDAIFTYGYFAILLLVVLIFVGGRNINFRLFFMGVFWFFLFLIPSLIRSNVYIPADFLEHRIYLPLVGVIIVILEIINSLKIKIPPISSRITAAFFLLLFSILTFSHTKNFKDGFSYWSSAIETSPNSIIAHKALGNVYNKNNLLHNALAEYKKAVEIDPYHADAYQNIGIIYDKLGLYKNAEEAYRKAIALNPNFAEAYQNLGIVLDKQSLFEDAEINLRKAIELDINSAEIYNNLGINLSKQEKLKDAENAFHRALSINPNYGSAHYNISILYYSQNNYDSAFFHCNRAVELGFQVSDDYLKLLGIRKK